MGLRNSYHFMSGSIRHIKIFSKSATDDDGGARAIDDKLISLPIPDFEVLDNTKTIEYIDELIKIVFQTTTKKVYIHCYGGHGRSGVIGSLLLQAIYGMDSMTAIKFLNHIHWVRHANEVDVNNEKYRLPESNDQRQQIHDLHESMMLLYHKYRKLSGK
eukprot:377447_1